MIRWVWASQTSLPQKPGSRGGPEERTRERLFPGSPGKSVISRNSSKVTRPGYFSAPVPPQWSSGLKVEVDQLCPTLCDPMDCSLPGSSVHGILQARILEWVVIPSPGDLPDPGIEPRSPTLQTDSLPSQPPGKLKKTGKTQISDSSSDPSNCLRHLAFLFPLIYTDTTLKRGPSCLS